MTFHQVLVAGALLLASQTAEAQALPPVVAQAAQRAAAARQSLARGAAVSDTSGTALGTVDSADDQFAVVRSGNGTLRVPLSAFQQTAGGFTCLLSAAQLAAINKHIAAQAAAKGQAVAAQ